MHESEKERLLNDIANILELSMLPRWNQTVKRAVSRFQKNRAEIAVSINQKKDDRNPPTQLNARAALIDGEYHIQINVGTFVSVISTLALIFHKARRPGFDP